MALRRDPGDQGLRPRCQVGQEMAYDAEADVHRWLGRGKTLAKGRQPSRKASRRRYWTNERKATISWDAAAEEEVDGKRLPTGTPKLARHGRRQTCTHC